MEEPRAIPDAEYKRAAEEESLRQKGIALRRSLKYLATQLRCIAAGELAGARHEFGGIGPLLANLATVGSVAFASNQESAAKLREARNAEWRRLAIGRRDFSMVKRQLAEPYQLRTTRALAKQKKACGVRARKPVAGEQEREPEGPKKQKGRGRAY